MTADSGTPGTVTGAWFSVLTDLRGDVLELLDSDGNRFAGYRYNVWGSHSGGLKSVNTSAIPADLETRIVARQELRYAGYAYDAAHDLYYCSARYYDPVTRQFVSRDPAKWDGAQSNYQYCGGNPVLANDPTGERLDSGDGWSARRNSKGKWVAWDIWGAARRASYNAAQRAYYNTGDFKRMFAAVLTHSAPSLPGNNAVTTKSAVTGGKAVAMGGGSAVLSGPGGTPRAMSLAETDVWLNGDAWSDSYHESLEWWQAEHPQLYRWGNATLQLAIMFASRGKGGEGAGASNTWKLTPRPKGSRFEVVKTDATKSEISESLVKNGFVREPAPSGGATNYFKGGTKYSLRDRTRSQDGPTLDYYPPWSPDRATLKIRIKP